MKRRERIGNTLRGIPKTPEHRKKTSDATTLQHKNMSEEERKRINEKLQEGHKNWLKNNKEEVKEMYKKHSQYMLNKWKDKDWAKKQVKKVLETIVD